jgi:hypothetical protein
MSTVQPPRDQLLDDEGRATFLSHFLGAHRAFRRDAARFPVALRRIGAPEEPDRIPHPDALRRHWEGYEAALVHHHHMEDELLFPPLRDLAPAVGEVIDELAVQHHELDRTIAGVHEALDRLPAADAVERSVRVCEELAAALGRHLGLEEEHLVPIMRATMLEPRLHGDGGPDGAPEEGGHAEATGHAFVLPWVADGLDDDTVAALLGSQPSAVGTTFPAWHAAYTDQLDRWWW